MEAPVEAAPSPEDDVLFVRPLATAMFENILPLQTCSLCGLGLDTLCVLYPTPGTPQPVFVVCTRSGARFYHRACWLGFVERQTAPKAAATAAVDPASDSGSSSRRRRTQRAAEPRKMVPPFSWITLVHRRPWERLICTGCKAEFPGRCPSRGLEVVPSSRVLVRVYARPGRERGQPQEARVVMFCLSHGGACIPPMFRIAEASVAEIKSHPVILSMQRSGVLSDVELRWVTPVTYAFLHGDLPREVRSVHGVTGFACHAECQTLYDCSRHALLLANYIVDWHADTLLHKALLVRRRLGSGGGGGDRTKVTDGTEQKQDIPPYFEQEVKFSYQGREEKWTLLKPSKPRRGLLANRREEIHQWHEYLQSGHKSLHPALRMHSSPGTPLVDEDVHPFMSVIVRHNERPDRWSIIFLEGPASVDRLLDTAMIHALRLHTPI